MLEEMGRVATFLLWGYDGAIFFVGALAGFTLLGLLAGFRRWLTTPPLRFYSEDEQAVVRAPQTEDEKAAIWFDRAYRVLGYLQLNFLFALWVLLLILWVQRGWEIGYWD